MRVKLWEKNIFKSFLSVSVNMALFGIKVFVDAITLKSGLGWALSQ